MLDETYDMLEKAVQVQLQNVVELEPNTKEGKDALAKSVALVELLVSVDKLSFESVDKEERRRIDEERNKAADETERQKQEITWSRVGLELAKAIAPILVSFVGYDVFQKRVLKFEETGRISSTAGRELHLPKILK